MWSPITQAFSPNSYIIFIRNQSINDPYIDGLVQERHNPIANALELRISCTNPSILLLIIDMDFLYGEATLVFCQKYDLCVLPL